MKNIKSVTTLLLLVVCTFLAANANGNRSPKAGKQHIVTITSSENAPANIKLAAKEVRRYVYLRTGKLLPIVQSASGNSISFNVDKTLEEQQYQLKSDGQSLIISGGSDMAVLYGAYDFAEKLGVRFYLHGDVVPDEKIPFSIPLLTETHEPLFETRGILPFHDFPEGPDWWKTDDYLVYIGQLAKMKMNFIGMHNYPGELLLWHGIAADVLPDGKVKTTYPSKWFTNTQSGWGYKATPTSNFSAGAADLFPSDSVFSEVVGEDDHHFDRAGKLLSEIVSEAHSLGIKVCVGTESPIWIPNFVTKQLEESGKPNMAKEIYKGMFTWLMKNTAIDYYWLWTPEGWIWKGNTQEQYDATKNDIQAALDALNELEQPFPLVTCGWVLGPQQNRSAWDQMLPQNSPMANINLLVGHVPVDSSFSTIQSRPKWAIPWLENDPDLTAYQPWVKRMRYDAADALKFGCTGLIGIHWRTKILSANIAALAQAGWSQSWDNGHQPVSQSNSRIDRAMPANDFYLDFARAHFGDQVAEKVSSILTEVDGFGTTFNPVYPGFSATTEWNGGPGALRVIHAPWDSIKNSYVFAEKFASLRSQVKGAGNLDRFDYWMNTFRATELMAKLACQRGELDMLVEKMANENDAVEKAKLAKKSLNLRQTLVRDWDKLITLQLMATSTPGEIGTIANLEQHSRANNQWLNIHDEAIAKALKSPLPSDCEPSKNYSGSDRLILSTVRTSVNMGETLRLPIITMVNSPCLSVKVHYRKLGAKAWLTMAACRMGRSVYEANLPGTQEDFEYYVTAETAKGGKLVWPCTAPELNQTVITK